MQVVPIEDDYVIGKELGRGRFSIVCECVHKVTGVHCAVKIIDKTTIEPEEKGVLPYGLDSFFLYCYSNGWYFRYIFCYFCTSSY